MRCNFYLLRLKSVKQVEKQLSVKRRKMLKIVPINVTVNELHLLKKLKENLLKRRKILFSATMDLRVTQPLQINAQN